MQYVERVVMRHEGILFGIKRYIKHKTRVVTSQTKQSFCEFSVENIAVFGQKRPFFPTTRLDNMHNCAVYL